MGFGKVKFTGFNNGLIKVSGQNWQNQSGEVSCEDCGHLTIKHVFFMRERDEEPINKKCSFLGCPCE